MSLDLSNKTIFGKYKVNKMIGKGSFGYVFRGKNISTKELVAIKVEDWKIGGNILESEAYFLYYLKNYGIPEIKSFGIYQKYKILVQTLLGEDLEKIFSSKSKNVNYKDICMVFIQLLDRLEFVHSKYVIHRDLKPENIMIDLETKSIIYLIDFGMAKKYRSGKTKKHIKFSIPSRLTGTARYCSINALRGTEQSRRDDLESAGYVMIYLAQRGYLPWIGLNMQDKLERYRNIYKIKKRTSPEELCKYLPHEFCDYIKYVKKLKFEEDPNYNYMRGLFIQLLTSLSCQNDLKFSWHKNKKEKENINQNNQRNKFFKRKISPQYRLLRNIQTSQEREKGLDQIKDEKLENILEEKQEKRDNEIIEINKKKELLELSLRKNNIDIIQQTPTFQKVNEENIKSEDETQIAQFNKSIAIDDSEDNNKIDETRDITDIKKNNVLEDKKNIEDEKEENVNVIKGINNTEEKKEKKGINVFLFENDSFKGNDLYEQKINSKDKNIKINININKSNGNNINDINNNIYDSINLNKSDKKNDINNNSPIEQNVDSNFPTSSTIPESIISINNTINKSSTFTNNKVKKKINNPNNNNKIIKIILNKNEKPMLNSNKNKSSKISIKNKIIKHKPNLNIINPNQINIYGSYNSLFNNIPKANNVLTEENINNSIKTCNTINSINRTKRNLSRKVINYNKIDSKNRSQEGRTVNNLGPNLLKSSSYKGFFYNTNYSKEINGNMNQSNNLKKICLSKKNSPKKNLIIQPYFSNNPETNLTPIGLTTNYNYNERNANYNRLLYNSKLSLITLPTNNYKRNKIVKMRLLPINVEQINSKFNNNFINNLNYSINYVNKDRNITTHTNSYKSIIQNKSRKNLEYQRLKRINISKKLTPNISGINNVNLNFQKDIFMRNDSFMKYNNKLIKKKNISNSANKILDF